MPSLRELIVETAQDVGVNPADLATVISYETAGTFDPRQGGPVTRWGRHKGLIQFGEMQARKYGVDFSSPEAALSSQLGKGKAISRYLKDAGVKPGVSFLDLYSAVNAGSVGRAGASDQAFGGAPGSVADKVISANMLAHKRKASDLFDGKYTPSASASDTTDFRYLNTDPSYDDSIPDLYQPQRTSPLADELSSSVSPPGQTSSAGGGVYDDFAAPSAQPVTADDGSARLGAAAEDPTPADTADLGLNLADVFKIRNIGAAGLKNPQTGLPALPRSRWT